MTVEDLNEDQKIQLKQAMLFERGSVAFSELADPGATITDQEMKERFKGVVFSEGDFSEPFQA